MEFPLLHFLTFLSLTFVASHAILTSEEYWNSVLPNTRMPKVITESLHPTRFIIPPNHLKFIKSYQYQVAATEDELKESLNVFLLQKDITPGTKIDLQFTKSTSTASTFLPRQVADSIPFSSNKLPEILNKFSVKPNSAEAEMIKKTISKCEGTKIVGEEKYCATSLESMIDFTTSKLGKKVKAISTEVNKENRSQKYSIAGAKKLTADKVVACHKEDYAYPVFYCHKTLGTIAYTVSLVGADGTKLKAVALCHTDTTAWIPKFLAFQLLKVKPGTVPVCHYIPEDHILWVPY